MSTRRTARTVEPWKSFLYSDPDGFSVKEVKFANGTSGRGLFAEKKFETHDFLLTYWGPRKRSAVSNLDYVMEVQDGKGVVFIDTYDERNSEQFLLTVA